MAASADEHPDGRVVVLGKERARSFLRSLANNSFVTLMYVNGHMVVYMKGCDDEAAQEMLVEGMAAFMHQ